MDPIPEGLNSRNDAGQDFEGFGSESGGHNGGER